MVPLYGFDSGIARGGKGVEGCGDCRRNTGDTRYVSMVIKMNTGQALLDSAGEIIDVKVTQKMLS